MATLTYSEDDSVTPKMATITLGAGTYTGTLTSVLTDPSNNYDPTTHSLTIKGAGSASTTWTDFQFSYIVLDYTSLTTLGTSYVENVTLHGRPTKLHIENITFKTTSLNRTAVLTDTTITTMDDVVIEGYSGDHNGTLISSFTGAASAGSRWLETYGGAVSINNADYTN